MKLTYEELIEVIKKCHRKHCLDDDSIGWEELTDLLSDTLRDIFGDNGYCEYVELFTNYK